MDIKELMADSKRRLINNDLVYRERVDVVLALLRALGVLSCLLYTSPSPRDA